MLDQGMSVKRAAAAVGAVKTSGRRWVDQRDGIVRVSPFRSSCGRSLALREREEIAIGLDRGWTCQAIGDAIGRDRSVIKREVDRNSNVTGVYRGYTAQLRADERLRRPKAAKIVANAQLRAEVIDKLVLRWSPEQISAHLKVEFADRAEMQVSHETIYRAVYVQAKGNLKAEVAQALRTGRAVRRAHGRVPSNARRIPDKIMISERPAEIADRAVPGHWEGDLIMGKANKSAIGTLVERSTRHVMLLHLPHVTDVIGVRDAMIAAMKTLPDVMRRSVTWDQGFEMRRHAEITVATGVAIYFCDPHSPWQRGTNENTNGLLRQYFPKGTDLSVHSPAYLRFVADQLNDRPRKTPGFEPPAKVFNELIVASTA